MTHTAPPRHPFSFDLLDVRYLFNQQSVRIYLFGLLLRNRLARIMTRGQRFLDELELV